MIGIGWYKKSKNDKKIFQYMKEQNNFEKNIDLVVCTGFRIHAVKRKHGGKKRIDMAEKMDENITHMLAGCDRNSFIDIFMGKCVVFKDRGKNCFACYLDSAFGNVCP